MYLSHVLVICHADSNEFQHKGKTFFCTGLIIRSFKGCHQERNFFRANSEGEGRSGLTTAYTQHMPVSNFTLIHTLYNEWISYFIHVLINVNNEQNCFQE